MLRIKTMIFILSILIFFYSCSTYIETETKEINMYVPTTGVYEGYVEIAIENEPRDEVDTASIVDSIRYILKNISHSYSLDFEVMICLKGEAKVNQPRYYFQRQSRWNDSSLTINIGKGKILPQDSLIIDSISISKKGFLFKMLKTSIIYIVVKNAIDSLVYTEFFNDSISLENSSKFEILYPYPNNISFDILGDSNIAIVADPYIKLIGVNKQNFSSTQEVLLYINNIFWGRCEKNKNIFYANIPIIEYFIDNPDSNYSILITTKLVDFEGNIPVLPDTNSNDSSFAPLPLSKTVSDTIASDSVRVMFKPSILIKNFIINVKFYSKIKGSSSLFSIF